MGIEHHALPDGFAERLEDIGDRLAMMPYGLSVRQFEDYKNNLIRQLAKMAEFPHPVEG
jgi:hypothetical protein